MALGVAQATYDYIVDNRQTFRETEKTSLDRFAFRLQTVRATVQSAAVAADADPSQGTLASMAKVMAVDLVEDITEAALPFFGPGALLDHPFLNKWYRDARGFEYMEGTSHIHRLKVGQAFALGKLSYD
jgi:alkylation response protein AidB-like acyl-CoA dehydrogenase